MIVTSVTKIDSRRQKVTLDNEYVFSLYNSEIKKYNITEECQLSEEFISSIERDVLYPRAKERALYLLGSRDRTKKQLTDKLNEAFYPQNIVDKVVEFASSYGYIDDERFAASYIKIKSSSKSRKQIECELVKKGISHNIIRASFQGDYDDYECEAIRKLLNKTKYKAMLDDTATKGKVIASMLRRGFEYEKITRCIDEMNK